MRKSEIVVFGAYGCGNRGDDAILQSIVEAFPNQNICATTGNFEDVASWLPVTSVKCRLNEGFSIPVLLSMIKNSFSILASIFSSRMLIFGGGSLIHDLTPYNLPFLYLWQSAAKLFRKKVVYFAMGVGPLNSKRGKSLSKFFLSKADGLYVRDQRGLDICHELKLDNAIMIRDAVFLLQEKNKSEPSVLALERLEEKEYVCVTASQWFQSSNFWTKDSINFESEIDNFARCITAFSSCTGKQVVFVPTVFHDMELGIELQKRLGKGMLKIVPATYSSKQMAEIIENSWMLLGVRMHSIIFAAKQGVPFLPIIYDEKVKQLLDLLDLQNLAINLSEVTPEKVTKKLDIILQNYEKIRENLIKKSKMFCEIDMEAVNEIRSLLDA